jgi:hypothetical protein
MSYQIPAVHKELQHFIQSLPTGGLFYYQKVRHGAARYLKEICPADSLELAIGPTFLLR